MKLYVALYRTVDFPSDWLQANVPTSSESLEAKLRTRFGPLAPRLKLFVTGSNKATAGIEVMTFDAEASDTPTAGLVMADPINQSEIDRVDGALRSELERIGIPSEIESIQWRIYYQAKGN